MSCPLLHCDTGLTEDNFITAVIKLHFRSMKQKYHKDIF